MKRFEKYYGWIIAFVFCVAVIAVYKTFDNFNNITQYLAKIFDAVKPFFIAFIIAYILNIPAKRMQKWLSKSKKSFIKKTYARYKYYNDICFGDYGCSGNFENVNSGIVQEYYGFV